MKRKRIVVTADDIRKGERKSYCDCPVARAVKRAFHVKRGRNVTVRHEGIFVGGVTDSRLWVGVPPREVERFLERFDQGKAVRPFETTVEFR